ncbi:hypothetical protein HNR21_004627 [Actinomadura cellulosilytica]|uniref:Uncharacterized protein n=2 Tax=Thermomonospora cellulosilytica TaxID=1411118 RepID=A0A7W3RAX3_9ACTN|nr:hypothetical protein [Thermomonospora cellulosilytica]
MEEMPTVSTLDDLVKLVEKDDRLFVRWSRGPQADAKGCSHDDLTGVQMPGLSANPLAVEDWWAPRPLVVWVARRLYDYSHLEREKGPGVRPWILVGEELGRGPDNEPLVRCVRPVAWIDEALLSDAKRVVAEQRGEWGPMRRPADV